jgi:hypothetical protein
MPLIYFFRSGKDFFFKINNECFLIECNSCNEKCNSIYPLPQKLDYVLKGIKEKKCKIKKALNSIEEGGINITDKILKNKKISMSMIIDFLK